MSHSPYQLKDDPYSSHAAILDVLGEGRGRRLLDVGAADGFLAEILTARGFRVTALERDPAQADRARGRCEAVVVADLTDAVLFRRVGFAIATANARPEVKKMAHMVTAARGGQGAVHEVCELLLDALGHWPEILKKYEVGE